MTKDTKISIRINEQEKEQLKAVADKLDISVSQLLRTLIKEYLKGEQK